MYYHYILICEVDFFYFTGNKASSQTSSEGYPIDLYSIDIYEYLLMTRNRNQVVTGQCRSRTKYIAIITDLMY
jgi:hypothetical protein